MWVRRVGVNEGMIERFSIAEVGDRDGVTSMSVWDEGSWRSGR